ncbi:zinc finger protein DPF3-like isoform X1 [Anabas testudineus]|uniref:DPF1-3 N-terminal domain-containing protein n=1 Tax=Anabas testudineus TaxID=64144 RepID=A0A3Q1H6G8_ANATE|nr:zinc finger protein DPF3-like isoform X1 [Anabas testudineus]
MAAVIQNPLKALGDQFYKDAIEQCRSYNARLCAERSVRLPFLDSQTGVAQNNCYIWMERHHRSPGVASGQMYTYPARCWRKKRRLHNSTDPRLGLYGLQLDGGLMSKDTLPTQSTTLEALLRGEGLDKRNNSKNDEESLLEIQRVLEADAAEDAYNDDDDYEVDTPKRRHRGKGRGRGSGRRRTDLDDDKPYVCDNRYKQKQNSKSSTSAVYAKRYRNRTGLSYHYTHSHLAEEERAGERSTVVSRSPSAPQTDRHKRPKGSGGTSIPNNYCSKCQGSNKKTGKSGSPCLACQGTTDCGEEKEGGTFVGAEELFGTTSESDTSTFHGFEDDELEEPATNSNGISNRHR